MNPLLGILSFAATLASAILAIFFYFKAKRAKKPCYAKRSVNIVKDLVSKFESLEILYDGQKIENLTITKVAFWNAGSDTMDNHDIASADPIVIQVSNGCRILKAQKIYEKNSANKLELKTSTKESQFLIDFEYIDRGEGAIFQLFHTGTSNQDVKVLGTIKGAGKIEEWGTSRMLEGAAVPFHYRIFLGVTFLISPILASFILLYYPGLVFMGKEMPKISLFGNIISFTIPALISWIIAYYVLTRTMPRGFDAFYVLTRE